VDSRDAIVPAELTRFLPEAVTGEVTSVEPLHMGLSGARVYTVRAARGAFVLRVQPPRHDRSLRQHVLIQRRAAEIGVAPAIVHVDENEGAVLSVRVAGSALPAILGDPVQRPLALASITTQLRKLHAMDPAGVEALDAVRFARDAFERQRGRVIFPAWGHATGAALDVIAATLARDSRRVVSHNDLNPSNILWDGATAWLVDWEVAALSHPYYDLAALTTFLNVPSEAAYGLLQHQEQGALDVAGRATFDDLRILAALAIGCTFLGLVGDDARVEAPTRADAPSRAEFSSGMRAGRVALHSAQGQVAYGLTMLRAAMEDAERLHGVT
jgi:aminoglycoside phosphotransferase (APT) family kinase protein